MSCKALPTAHAGVTCLQSAFLTTGGERLFKPGENYHLLVTKKTKQTRQPYGVTDVEEQDYVLLCDGSPPSSSTDGPFPLHVPSTALLLAFQNVRLLIKKPQTKLMTK